MCVCQKVRSTDTTAVGVFHIEFAPLFHIEFALLHHVHMRMRRDLIIRARQTRYLQSIPLNL